MKKPRAFYLIILFLAVFKPLKSKANNESGFVNSFKVGARFASLSEYRGVILYKDYQLTPIIAAYFLDNKIEFLTSSVSYRDFIYNDQIRFRSRLSVFSDNPVLPKHESVFSNYPDREDTYEWLNRLEFFTPSYSDYSGEFDIGLFKDLKAHKGIYAEASVKLKIMRTPLQILKGNSIEPNLFYTIGYGDKKHNEYYYGAADSSGLNNFAYGLWFNFPELADRYTPIIMLKRFEVMGDKNRNGALARDRDNGWMISFVGAVNIL